VQFDHLSDSKEHVAVLGKNFLPEAFDSTNEKESLNIQKKLFATFSHIFSYMKRFSETSAHYWIGLEGGEKLINDCPFRIFEAC
jgi:hypothetical protein